MYTEVVLKCKIRYCQYSKGATTMLVLWRVAVIKYFLEISRRLSHGCRY